jgi:hypothetical protein
MINGLNVLKNRDQFIFIAAVPFHYFLNTIQVNGLIGTQRQPPLIRFNPFRPFLSWSALGKDKSLRKGLSEK